MLKAILTREKDRYGRELARLDVEIASLQEQLKKCQDAKVKISSDLESVKRIKVEM